MGVAVSALEFLHLDDDKWQRLSSGLVAQLAATFGVKRNHTDALTTKTGSRKGGSRRVHAKQYSQRGVTLQNPLYNSGRIDQTGRVPFTPIYLIPIPPELSGNIPLETSRNPWNLPDPSRLFRIILVASPTQRSSPNGLIGTCVG